MNKKKLSIICPVYNEEECIPIFIEKIKKIEKSLLDRYFVNIYFSNNASTDNTYSLLKKYSEIYDNIFYLTLSKNFGYQNSLKFTLNEVSGDVFLIIDVDGEDPVELIPELIKKYENDNDIVYGRRVDRKENVLLKKFRKIFYRLLKIISDDEILIDMAEFSLFSNEVRIAIINENNSFPFLRSSISRVGYKSAEIQYTRKQRAGGKTNYSFYKICQFAIAGILTSTTLPLRLSLYIFPIWFFYWLYIFLTNLLQGKIDQITFFINFSILLIVYCLTFLSVYLARMYKNLLKRPNAYLVKRKSKFSK